MEAVKTIPTSLPAGIAPTFQALIPCLKNNAESIQKQYASRETHSYGSDPRQELDVYFPHQYSSKTPVLLFLFGGGFFMGEKRDPQFPELIYANLGAFFCNKGFITIVADYRLSKGPGNPNGTARYPSGGEDTALALKWISKTLGDRQIFLMGNSAGAVHVMTFLFEPSLRESVDTKVAGVVLVSLPCHQLNADAGRAPVNEAYYGSADAVYSNSPIALLIRNGPISTPILSLVASLDEEGIIKSWADYKKEYAKQGGEIDEIIMEGHNHISPIPALNSTEVEGSKWGDDAAQWMRSKIE